MMAQNSSINPRTLAFNILYKVSEDKAYSNIAVNTKLKESGLSGLDSAFVSAIVYGVLEKQTTIDYIIRQYSDLPMRKIEIKTLIILRMGIYQMIFMDKVPDSAAVNESVKIAKKKGLMKSCGFINAVLRNFVRADKKYSLAFPWIEKNLIYFNVRCYAPGQSLEKPPVLDQTVYITNDAAGHRLVFEFTHTLAAYVEELSHRMNIERSKGANTWKDNSENRIIISAESIPPDLLAAKPRHKQFRQRDKSHNEPER